MLAKLSSLGVLRLKCKQICVKRLWSSGVGATAGRGCVFFRGSSPASTDHLFTLSMLSPGSADETHHVGATAATHRRNQWNHPTCSLIWIVCGGNVHRCCLQRGQFIRPLWATVAASFSRPICRICSLLFSKWIHFDSTFLKCNQDSKVSCTCKRSECRGKRLHKVDWNLGYFSLC